LVAKILISSFDSEKNKSNKANIISMLFVVRSALKENLDKPNRWFLQPHHLIAEIDRRAYFFNKDKNLLQEIEEVSNLALTFNNQQARFYRLLGEKNILEGDYQDGEDFYNKSFEMTAKSPEDEVSLYKNIGAAYSEVGDKERSAENMMKAFRRYYLWRKKDPIQLSEMFSDKIRNDVVFWGKLIFLYNNDLKEEETAREIYKKSIEIFPEYKNVFIAVFGKIFQEE